MAQDKPDSGVRSVQVALDILELVAFSEDDIGVSQIAARCGLAKGATFRHLQTLAERGYVAQNPATARYQLGMKSHLLGRLAPQGANLLTVADGPMNDLREAIGATVVLSAPAKTGVRVLSTVTGKAAIEIGVRPGSELQFHSSAQGKIALAFGPATLLASIERRTLPALTPRTITQFAALQGEIARAREQGWVDAPEQALLGINAIAAPIFDVAHCVGAIAVVGSVQFVPPGGDPRLVSALRATAERISNHLGHRAGPAKPETISPP